MCMYNSGVLCTFLFNLTYNSEQLPNHAKAAYRVFSR